MDAAVREVNRLLGDTHREEGRGEGEGMGGQASLSHNSLLKVDRRYVHMGQAARCEGGKQTQLVCMSVCTFQVSEC